MRRKELLLVHAVGDEARFFNPESRRKTMGPLWPAAIAALTPRATWNVRAIDEGIRPCKLEPADLVGVGALTMNAARAYQLALEYRRRRTPVVMGGWHVSVFPEEALKYCDAVVVGEAETVWHRVLGDFERGRLERIYRADSPPDLSLVPAPRRSIFDVKYLVASVQFSRGCFGACDFCTIRRVYGKGVRYRPIDDVLREVESIPQKYVFFVDENFTGWTREQQEHVIELLQRWDRRRIRKQWSCEGSVNVVENPDMLAWMERTGCHFMFIGFEDISAAQLQGIRKPGNARIDPYFAVDLLHRHGIAVFGSFIIGLPGQTAQDVRRIIDFCVESGIDHALLAPAALVPGSRWWDEHAASVRYRRFPDDYANVSGSYLPVMPHSQISDDEWRDLYDEFSRRFYGPRSIGERLLRWTGQGEMGQAFMALGMGMGGRQHAQRLRDIDRYVDVESGRWKGPALS